MKTAKIFTIVALFLTFTGFQPGDRKQKRLQKEKEIYELIESGHFRFVANSAKSSLGNFDNLGTDYHLIFDSLKLTAYLPYYGRAYSVPYGGDGGVKFNLTAEKIDKAWNEKKKMYTLRTAVADSQDSYLMYLTTGLSGSIYLHFAKIKKTRKAGLFYLYS